MVALQQVSEAVKAGRPAEAVAQTKAAIEAASAPGEVLDAMVKAMDEIGRKFQCGEAGIKPEHTVVVGTVAGDLHDLGKNLVAMMWKGANFEVVDLGTDVSPARFVEAVREHNAPLVGLSVLLTTTMPAAEQTVKALRDAGLSDVKIMVGGAPVTEAFATKIGADGYAADAASAVEQARTLIGAAARG